MDRKARENLAVIVKALRGDMSQRRFAREFDVSYAAIRSWEDCDAVPDTKNLAKLATRAGYTLDGFIRMLEDRPLRSNPTVEDMVMRIKSLNGQELALITRAVSDRWTEFVSEPVVIDFDL